MIRQKNAPKQLIAELVETALSGRYCLDRVPPPGQIVSRLSQKERDILSSMKSDDLTNVRWPRPDGMNLEKLPRR